MIDNDDAAREEWAELDETYEAYKDDNNKECEDYYDWLLDNDHLFQSWSDGMKDEAAVSRAEEAEPPEAPNNWEP